MKQIYLEKFNQGGYFMYRVPSIAVTQRGTVIACYECRNGGDWSAMDLVIRRSTDGGDTWSERIYIAPSNDVDVMHNGILFADGDTVHLLYHRNYRELFYIKSTDEGVTWTEPRNISDAYLEVRKQYKWTVADAGPGHGFITRNGRMMIPVWLASNKANITDHHPSVVTTLYSDDHGATWQCGEIIWDSADFIDPNESVLAELPDGRIMISSRHETRNGMRKFGFSPDGISGWKDFYFEPQITEPICAAGMTQDDEHIWYTHCDCSEGRVNLCLHRSDDWGKTWNLIKQLDPLGGYSDAFYSSSDKRLYVIAETGREQVEVGHSFGMSVIILEQGEY